jgi:hypothetical protein
VCSFPCGTPVAGDILIEPGVEFKPIEADALPADGDFGHVRPHLGIESVAVHAEVGRRVAKAQDARQREETMAHGRQSDGSGSHYTA